MPVPFDPVNLFPRLKNLLLLYIYIFFFLKLLRLLFSTLLQFFAMVFYELSFTKFYIRSIYLTQNVLV